MLDYGFESELDYVLNKNVQNPNSLGGRPSKDYFLTIETAKEISMLQRTEKGKEARRYFIE
ncbi:AntA phage antirepressor N-terminal domain protein (plasmid) [Candidatus Megaera polyxenophila]|nr:AntA phage antirepressor N-terminal domain protein [Candidatus Megaera polyxenophila]